MKNKYKIIENIIIIYLKDRLGNVRETEIDLDDFDKVNNYSGTFYALRRNHGEGYYCRITLYLGIFNKKPKYKLIYLHQIILNTIDIFLDVDHKNHNTLDNKKENLLLSNDSLNIKNRKGVNKNNNTGFRNISFIKKTKKYWVQVMKDGKRYKKFLIKIN